MAIFRRVRSGRMLHKTIEVVCIKRNIDLRNFYFANLDTNTYVCLFLHKKSGSKCEKFIIILKIYMRIIFTFS